MRSRKPLIIVGIIIVAAFLLCSACGIINFFITQFSTNALAEQAVIQQAATISDIVENGQTVTESDKDYMEVVEQIPNEWGKSVDGSIVKYKDKGITQITFGYLYSEDNRSASDLYQFLENKIGDHSFFKRTANIRTEKIIYSTWEGEGKTYNILIVKEENGDLKINVIGTL